jgi:hypothetical protein
MNRRRSERVLLQIHVLVETQLEAGTLVRLDAFTLVVNAHGGLLEMSLKVPQGQKLILTNPVLGMREACRVVGTKATQDAFYAVAIEFDRPSPQFWPITFPPADWSLVGAEN